jgi:hypothetical protein
VGCIFNSVGLIITHEILCICHSVIAAQISFLNSGSNLDRSAVSAKTTFSSYMRCFFRTHYANPNEVFFPGATVETDKDSLLDSFNSNEYILRCRNSFVASTTISVEESFRFLFFHCCCPNSIFRNLIAKLKSSFLN